MYEQILYDVKDPVAVITLNRPDALNALTGRMQREFKHALAEAESDPAVVGVVLTGACRGFCEGVGGVAGRSLPNSIGRWGSACRVDSARWTRVWAS